MLTDYVLSYFNSICYVDCMGTLLEYISSNIAISLIAIVTAFIILARCADVFVDNAVIMANRFKIPKVVIGIILVSLATTTPELTVSMMSAINGQPQMALGNALGSVVCNLGLALALCAFVSPKAIPVCPRVGRLSGGFMLLSMLVCAAAVMLNTSEQTTATGTIHLHSLSRFAGIILLLIYGAYAALLLKQQRTKKEDRDLGAEVDAPINEGTKSLTRCIVFFAISLTGIILCGRVIVAAATTIAGGAGIPEAVIGLTLVALGTSVPEIATCVSAARRGHGEIAIGNVIGANILNICWVAGGSAIVNTLTITRQEVSFMLISVASMVIA